MDVRGRCRSSADGFRPGVTSVSIHSGHPLYLNVCYYEKLTEARLLDSQRDARKAGELRDQWSWSAEGPLFVLGVLDRGRLAEGLGERRIAIDSYQFVVDVWRHADPELAGYVREARAGLERVAAGR
jgi:hypothetical protein